MVCSPSSSASCCPWPDVTGQALAATPLLAAGSMSLVWWLLGEHRPPRWVDKLSDFRAAAMGMPVVVAG
jgi:hypothetical protein